MSQPSSASLVLEDGARIAVIGGGPAGSFFSYFLLLFAERTGRSLHVDIYDPRDFWGAGPASCNMCGGIVSESLVESLALEGIEPPDSVVQRGLDSYVLHTAAGTSHIETPSREMRIAAVHRGGGPKGSESGRWESFDAHLLKLALAKGASYYCARVSQVRWNEGRPEVQIGALPPRTYDLLVGAVGVNSSDLKLFEELGFAYRRPATVKTYITELQFGAEGVRSLFGSSMHVFLLDLPRLDFAALIPKGDYVTMCMLGREIDKELVDSFFAHPVVRACFPRDWTPPHDTCHCSPRMYFAPARHPFADRVVLIGDAGVSRLYKDGIGAAYRSAKAAARTAVFSGVSMADFKRHYWPHCRRVALDNSLGKVVFKVVHLMQHWRFSCAAVVRLANAEARRPGKARRMSAVLWDTFTGSSTYRAILVRTLHPAFLVRLFVAHLAALRPWPRRRAARAPVESA
ncbi:MAG: hypothetical protein V1750_10015 [Acidobacteriota bacterium]